MNVVLIWPYNPQALEIPELFPLGLGFLHANIDLAKHKVHIWDCTLDRLSPQSSKFAEKLKDIAPDVVGISFWSSNADSNYKTCDTIRRILPDTTIVFGGPHATSYGRYEIEKDNADFVIAGEAELSFPLLLDAIENNAKKVLSSIPGLIYRNDSGGVEINPVKFVYDLDSLGNVDYELLRLTDYHKAGYGYSGQAVLHPNLPSALIITTRGCPYRCRFCSAPMISGKKIRTHSPLYLAKMIEKLYKEFNVRIITLGDDNFTMNKTFAEDLCSAIIGLHLDDLIMVAPNGFRITSLTPKLAKLLLKAGWEEVTVAPESGSPHTLELMHKDIDLDIVKPFVEMCHSTSLKVKANFIIGFPGETIKDVEMTERFILENDFDQIGLCFFQPLPGTPIFNELIQQGDLPLSFVPGKYSQLTYCPSGIDKDELCLAFNRIWNQFRDGKGWKYKNAKIGTIREEINNCPAHKVVDV
jgi:anaerobic magnesium-protoporphyrin IX monomethyl ester cyclase